MFIDSVYELICKLSNRANAKKTQCEMQDSLYCHIFSLRQKNDPREILDLNIKISAHQILRNCLFSKMIYYFLTILKMLKIESKKAVSMQNKVG